MADLAEGVDGVEHLAGCLRRQEALVCRRLDKRERDRVDADVVLRELDRQVLRQRVAPRLRSRAPR